MFFILNFLIVYETLSFYLVLASFSGGPLAIDTNSLLSNQVENENIRPYHKNLVNFRRETKEIQRLRFQVDKMSLKQKMDKIKIEKLTQKMNMMEKKFANFLQSNAILQQNNGLGLPNYKILKQSEEPLRTPFNPENTERQNREKSEFEQKYFEKFEKKEQLISEEIEFLREEFLKLKEGCSKCSSKPSKTTSMEGRDHSSIEWVMQIIPSLQKNVQDLQESTNVIRVLHEKQDVGTKLDLVIEDAKKQQKLLTKLTSESEATSATLKTLSDEFKETSSRVYELESTFISVKSELKDEKGAIEELLKALPDGFLSTKPNADQIPFDNPLSLEASTTPPGVTSASVASRNKIDHLEKKISSLDFALMNLQKKVFFNTHNFSIGNDSLLSEESRESIPNNCNQKLSNRISEIEFELSKIQDSSKAMLDIISVFENRNGISIRGVDDKLSIVETQIEKEIEDRTLYNIETKSEIRDDYVELKNDISNLQIKLISIQDSINRSVSPNIDKSQIFLSKINETCVDIVRRENKENIGNISDIGVRLKKLEKLVSRKAKFSARRRRHKHGLKRHKKSSF